MSHCLNGDAVLRHIEGLEKATVLEGLTALTATQSCDFEVSVQHLDFDSGLTALTATQSCDMHSEHRPSQWFGLTALTATQSCDVEGDNPEYNLEESLTALTATQSCDGI